MNPMTATVRVRAGAKPEVVGVHASAGLEEMAWHVVSSALGAAAGEVAQPGVYRVVVEGEPKKPTIRVSRLAGPTQSVITAVVVRDGPSAVHVHSVHVTLAEGAASGTEERAHKNLAEAAAVAARTAAVGEQRAIEVVLD